MTRIRRRMRRLLGNVLGRSFLLCERSASKVFCSAPPTTTTTTALAARAATEPPAFAGLGFSQTKQSGLVPQLGKRSIYVEVEDNSEIDFCFKKLTRKLNQEGVLLESRIRSRHTKKSDQKIIDQRSTAKRLARKSVGRKIRWIMKRRERGF